jgi:hypothetical protein
MPKDHISKIEVYMSVTIKLVFDAESATDLLRETTE